MDEVVKPQEGGTATTPAVAAPVVPPTPAPPSSEEVREAAMRWLDSAPPEEIMRNNRLGGILGQRMNAAREQIRREEQQANAERIRRETEAEFEKLANDDPAEFSKRYLSAKEQERIKNQQWQIAEAMQAEFGSAIGDAFKGLAEFQDLTPEDFARLSGAVAGKQGKDVLSSFAVTAADIVAEKKANKKMSEFRAKELDKEREAIRSEEAAKLLQSSPRPDVANGANTRTTFDPTKLSDKEFAKWYDQNFKSRL